MNSTNGERAENPAGRIAAPRREKAKTISGSVKAGGRGKIVIPEEARGMSGTAPGETLPVPGDPERGVAIVRAGGLREFARMIPDAPAGTGGDTRDR